MNEKHIGTIMNIILSECKTRNLEYVNLKTLSSHNERVVFDILTKDQNSDRKDYVIHIDFTAGRVLVEQFLDCVYGSGSTSDLKIIIYNDVGKCIECYEYFIERYFVTRLINKSNAVNIPFDIIGFNDPLDKSALRHEVTLDYNQEAVESYLHSGPLPGKWDILRMAFWERFYNTNHDIVEPCELHRLHPVRSLGMQIMDDLMVLTEWIEDGIYYVITDNDNSKFISWLWKYRNKYFGNAYTDNTMSTYQDGAKSCFCLLYKDTPVQHLMKLSYSERQALGRSLYSGASKLGDTVAEAYEQYKSELEPVNDLSSKSK